MPPKITVTKEQVLEAGLDLLRREGLRALSARKVAQVLGCSTRPVYRVFTSMEDLKKEVLLRASSEVEMLLSRDCAGAESPFLALGLNSLRLARDEPHLYRAVIQGGGVLQDLQQGRPPPEFILERMRADPLLAALSDEQLTRINTLMWFFSQGLATLLFSELEEDSMALAEKYLGLAGRAVLEQELMGRCPSHEPR